MRPGLFCFPRHQVDGTVQYIAAIKPTVVKGFLSVTSASWWGNVQQASPSSIRILVHGEISDNPDLGTPEYDAEQTAREVDKDRRLPRLIITKNEPPVHLGLDVRKRLSDYLCRWLTRAHALGLNGVVGEFSNGWPRVSLLDGEDWWPEFRAVEDAMDGNDAWGLHEYWGTAGPLAWWPWTVGRHLGCPTKRSIIIDECGFDLGVDGYAGNMGWVGRIPQAQYVDQIVTYHRMITDPRVKGTALFLLDYDNNHWASFDIWAIKDLLQARNGECNEPSPYVTPPATIPTQQAPPVARAIAPGVVDSAAPLRVNHYWGMAEYEGATASAAKGTAVQTGDIIGQAPGGVSLGVTFYGAHGTPPSATTAALGDLIGAELQRHILPLNPRAAFEIEGARRGLLPASDEFDVVLNGTAYRAQGFRRPGEEAVQYYVYAPVGQWDKQTWLTRPN